MAKRKGVERPYNGGTWTRARYMSQIRSHLRRAFKYWKPAMDAKREARRPNQSENKRLKWEYQCAVCKHWFPEKEIQVDHIIPCGKLNCMEDIVPFIERLTVEKDGFQAICKECHQIKTNKERRNGRKGM